MSCPHFALISSTFVCVVVHANYAIKVGITPTEEGGSRVLCASTTSTSSLFRNSEAQFDTQVECKGRWFCHLVYNLAIGPAIAWNREALLVRSSAAWLLDFGGALSLGVNPGAAQVANSSRSRGRSLS
uniref:Secreted protein n=1 Tax=Eutreptiella gymnastica TaxID=73025 RepID=A0A7S4LDW4_9EUGL